MHVRILATAILIATVASSLCFANAASNEVVHITPALISQLADQMRSNHPTINAQVYRAKAADANVRAVRTWEDPMAKIGGMGARTDMRADDGDLIYGVEQKLPLFGKPQAARKVAQAAAAVEDEKTEVQFQALRRELAKLLFRSALADRTVVLTEQDIGWLGTLAESVEARYRSGTASLTETLQAQNERARRANALLTDRSNVEHERLALGRILSRDVAWGRLELPEPATPVAFSPRLVQLALTAEPKLRTMRQELRRSEAAVDVAKRQRMPEVGVGLQGRTFSRNGDFRSVEAMLVFNLPWGNRSKYRAELDREKAMAVAMEYDIDNEERALGEEVHQLTIMIDNARREALLYRDEIIPRSRAATEAAQTAWTSGTGMLRDVLEARRMLTEAELMYARAIAEQYQALSELVLCCGAGDFEALQNMIGVHEDAKPRQ